MIQLNRCAAMLALLMPLICGFSPPPQAPAQSEAPANEPQHIAGTPIDPATHGPGVIESMDVVLERERNRPPENRNPNGRNGAQGVWVVPSPRATTNPRSGLHNVVNKWGDTRMGIGFPRAVTVEGAYFNGQAGRGAWTKGIRVIGFRDGVEVAATEWFRAIGEQPQWFAMNLRDVDRMVIEAIPVIGGAGWYAMDDLTYVPPSDDPAAPAPQPVVIDFEDCRYHQTLTGTNYAGLNWETGTGDFNVDEGVHAPLKAEADEGPPPPGAEQGGIAGGNAIAPTLLSEFQGVIRGDAGSFSYPPDTCGAVGPSHYIEVVNRNFSVYDRNSGVRLINTTLGSFLPGSNGDPRVLFDQYSNRWIIIVCDFNERIYLAVSLTSEATGNWFKTNFNVSQGSDAGCWPDYPTLGVDANGIYTSAYMVGCGLSIFALEKAPLIAPSPALGTITAFRGLPMEGAIQPAHTYGPADGQYFVSRQNSTQIRIRRLTGPLSSPVLTEHGSALVPTNSSPPDAPALGSNTPLDTVGSRLINAVYRDGSIWTAHTINVSNRAAVRWYQLNANPIVTVQVGTIADPVRHYFFPGIAVNALGDMVVGFSGSHAGEYASAYYTGRSATDASGETAPPVLMRAGTAPQNNIDSFGRNRWGDYSLTAVDPTDDSTLWTVQEYAHAENIWGTWVARLAYAIAPANNFCANSTIIGAGAHPFTTVNATTDGPNEPTACNFNGDTNIAKDVWFRLLTECTGTVTLELCGADFNSRMAVYTDCPNTGGQILACADDDCADDPQISFPVTFGQNYRIRIGGHNGASGSGTLSITCTPDPPCVGDVNNSGAVDVADLLAVINNWGFCFLECPPACAGDVDGDCAVNVADLLAVINAWGACP